MNYKWVFFYHILRYFQIKGLIEKERKKYEEAVLDLVHSASKQFPRHYRFDSIFKSVVMLLTDAYAA